jgi:hypothetical protein
MAAPLADPRAARAGTGLLLAALDGDDAALVALAGGLDGACAKAAAVWLACFAAELLALIPGPDGSTTAQDSATAAREWLARNALDLAGM